KFLITALMDDDDAWDRSLLETVVNDSHKFYSAGIERVGFTYPHGFEWLYTDLIDIDALQKGEKIIRKAGCYQYFYPFLTMTSFTFSVNEQNLGFIVAVHSSKGEILNDNNFRKVVIDSEFPAWLYFRNQQADSAIHKAHQLPEVNISTEEICKKFGLNYELISKIQSKAHEIPYAKKRVLGEPDKSSLLLNVSADETYHHIVKKRV